MLDQMFLHALVVVGNWSQQDPVYRSCHVVFLEPVSTSQMMQSSPTDPDSSKHMDLELHHMKTCQDVLTDEISFCWCWLTSAQSKVQWNSLRLTLNLFLLKQSQKDPVQFFFNTRQCLARSRCFLNLQWMLTKKVHVPLAEGLWGPPAPWNFP